MIGRVVGNYRIAEKIGEGGMGAVYRAVDLMLEREVALKAIRPELSREPQIVERFRAEARTLARVSHPAIANVYAFFYEGDELFLALEYLRGRTLSKVIETGGAIPWQRAVQLLASAMEGIEQAHRCGIVHRDLKPDNLMLTETGTLKVMDFGIARVLGSGHLTRTGLLVGTLRYMSPEQIRGEEVDGRADVYALGAVLYEMLTGRTPFEGTSDWAILRAQMEEIPRPPGEQVPLLPWWLDRAVLKALAKQPAERFQSVEEMRLSLLRQAETAPSVRPALSADAAAIADLPTIVTPPGSRSAPVFTPPPTLPSMVTPPALPGAQVANAGGHTTAASVSASPPVATPPPVPAAAWPVTPPPVPPSSSYRPVELGRKGGAGRKIAIVLVALFAFFGLAIAGLWLLASLAPSNSQSAQGTQTTPSPTDTPPAAAQEPTPSAEAEPASNPPPVPSLPKRGPRTEPTTAPAATDQSATTAEPETPETQETPAEGRGNYTGEPPVSRQGAFEELRTLAAELDTMSGDLVDRYKELLSKKEDSGAKLSRNDEKLKDDLEAFQDAAVTFDKQFQVGRWGRMFGHRPDDRRQTRENVSRLATLGPQVELLMNEVRPGPEVRQAWNEVRRRWKRVGAVVAGLRE
ncbi:MAG TPA: protein kinase [Thermoanaerobaculia bacterium]|jgi:serine/threonine-protein kinase|nr:protein kinase [Thermoanaerobaculia bacterium]